MKAIRAVALASSCSAAMIAAVTWPGTEPARAESRAAAVQREVDGVKFRVALEELRRGACVCDPGIRRMAF